MSGTYIYMYERVTDIYRVNRIPQKKQMEWRAKSDTYLERKHNYYPLTSLTCSL